MPPGNTVHMGLVWQLHGSLFNLVGARKNYTFVKLRMDLSGLHLQLHSQTISLVWSLLLWYQEGIIKFKSSGEHFSLLQLLFLSSYHFFYEPDAPDKRCCKYLLSNVWQTVVFEIRWLNRDATLARWVVIIINCWVVFRIPSFLCRVILIFPGDLYDLQNWRCRSCKDIAAITLPYMLFVTAPQLITQFVGNINNFNVIYLLSNGESDDRKYYQAGETDILVTWLFKLTMNSSGLLDLPPR